MPSYGSVSDFRLETEQNGAKCDGFDRSLRRFEGYLLRYRELFAKMILSACTAARLNGIPAGVVGLAQNGLPKRPLREWPLKMVSRRTARDAKALRRRDHLRDYDELLMVITRLAAARWYAGSISTRGVNTNKKTQVKNARRYPQVSVRRRSRFPPT